MNQYNNYFMGPGHSPRARPPLNNGEMPGNYNFDFGHAMGGGGRPIRPMHRMPQFQIPRNMNGYQDVRPRQVFGPRFPTYMSQGRPDNRPWNGGPRRRFPNPTMAPVPMQFHDRFSNDRRHPIPIPTPNNYPEFGDRHQPHYVLRTSIGDQRENYPRRVNKRFTEVCASVNFTIRTGSYDLASQQNNRGRKETNRIMPVNDVNPASLADDIVAPVMVDTGENDADVESSDESTVAVGSAESSPSPAVVSSRFFTLSDDDDSGESTELLEEEYEPENPEINQPSASSDNIIRSYSTTCPAFGMVSHAHEHRTAIASCDNEGFHEAFVGVCISSYPSALGRMMEVAGFGVWFSDGNKSMNFSGVLNPDRPQNTKAIMIHGSAQAVNAMKREGYSQIRVNLETEYLNENVLGWISKYMENPKAQPSNWDEVKYNLEILELCNAATGMLIKWSHCSDTSLKKSGIEKAKQLAKKATDTWMKDLRHRQEAVGTTQ